ncbi:phosphatase PAP2 family protein [Streptomyces sp. P1-3]|uniref:phosphatase PAP2 family protein n=1 Tax=Streptomyces sp. P1-3 TaxID=3421658 RepID=UPI003D36998D
MLAAGWLEGSPSGGGLDRRLLIALRDRGGDPRVAAAVRALSWCGEHGALWLAAGLTGAVRAGGAADPGRRAAWLRGTALVGAAHVASMGLKRVVRRPRPELPGRPPLVRTAARHSFPSSHAASSAAAAVAYRTLRPTGRWLPGVAAAMCVSRLVAGVHYPTDVAAGALLGALTARLADPWTRGPLGGSGRGAAVGCPASGGIRD